MRLDFSPHQWVCLDLHLDRPAPALRQERPFLFTQKGELRVLDQATKIGSVRPARRRCWVSGGDAGSFVDYRQTVDSEIRAPCHLNNSRYVKGIREGITGQARSEPSVTQGRAELGF